MNVGASLFDSCIDCIEVDGAIGEQIRVQCLPSVCLVSLQDIFGERDVGIPLDRYVVVVVDHDEVAELLRSGQ